MNQTDKAVQQMVLDAMGNGQTKVVFDAILEGLCMSQDMINLRMADVNERFDGLKDNLMDRETFDELLAENHRLADIYQWNHEMRQALLPILAHRVDVEV